MDFTFCVFAYNNEKIIIETLESIRWQIINYAGGISIDIIIIDDYSRDKTVTVIQKWLDIYKILFSNIIFKRNKENCGMVHNYNWALSQVKTKNFKVIAGDDLISSQNMFEKYRNLDIYTIRSYVCTELINNKIVYDEDRLILYFFNKSHKRDKKFDLHAMRRGCFFHSPSTLYTKELYNYSECKKFNSNFRNFEDDPTWYAMLKRYDDINIEFIDDIIVLYRIHEQSISNSNSSCSSKLFKKELQTLYKIYYRDSTGLEKLRFWFQINDKIPKYLRFDKYYDLVFKLYLKWWSKNNTNYKKFKKNILNKINTEQKYYDEIKRNTIDFFSSLEQV